MEFKVPLKYEDLTLGQLMTLHTEEDPFKRVSACADIPLEQLRKSSLKAVREADEHLGFIASREVGKHFKVITLGGEQYGFIPDWASFSLGEWMDMEDYCGDFWANANKIAAMLYRPIDRKVGEAYTIKPYTTKEDAEAFKKLPADVFGGEIIFFLNSRKELLNIIQSSLLTGVDRVINSMRSGDGIQPSTPLQGKTSSRWMRLRGYLSGLFSRTLLSLKT